MSSSYTDDDGIIHLQYFGESVTPAWKFKVTSSGDYESYTTSVLINESMILDDPDGDRKCTKVQIDNLSGRPQSFCGRAQGVVDVYQDLNVPAGGQCQLELLFELVGSDPVIEWHIQAGGDPVLKITYQKAVKA